MPHDVRERRLVQLLERAYQAVGPAEKASELAAALALDLRALHITTHAHICTALVTPTELEDVRQLVRGRLFTALQAEIAADRTAELASRPRIRHVPRKLPLEVKRVDVIQISAVDQVSQRYCARLYIQAAFVDGALDEHLPVEDDSFPLDEHGAPTFRPSARWYLSQFDFTNAVSTVQVIDSKVTKMGNSLMLNQWLEGEFFESFDLRKFPFDQQALTFTFALKVANEGPCPIKLSVASDFKRSLEGTHFALGNTWILADEMAVQLTTVGTSSARRFPALRISVTLRRLPHFYLVNVVLMASMLALMCWLQVTIPIDAIGDRFSFSLTLVLTVVSFKYAVTASMPEIAYLTLLDQFILLCMLIITAVVFEGGAVAQLAAVGRTQLAEVVDRTFFHAVLLSWLGVHLKFGSIAWQEWKRPARRGGDERDGDEAPTIQAPTFGSMATSGPGSAFNPDEQCEPPESPSLSASSISGKLSMRSVGTAISGLARRLRGAAKDHNAEESESEREKEKLVKVE